MKEPDRVRLKCFSEDIENGCKKISSSLSLMRNISCVNSSGYIIDCCRAFFYQLVDQIVLPYCVFGLEQERKGEPNISFAQFFENTDWVVKYPLVYSTAVTQLNLSVSNIVKAIGHLDNDWHCLSRQLEINCSDSVILNNLVFTNSDRHNFGQQTIVFLFKNGSREIRLLYKPRNMSHLNVLDDVLPNISIPGVYKASRDYGWQEYIYYSEPESLHDYYISAGKLLAVYSMINGTDAHFENVISCSNGPVVIDWETVFTNTSYFSEQNVDTDLVSFTGLVQFAKKWWQFWIPKRSISAALQADGDYRNDILRIFAIDDGTDNVSVGYGSEVPHEFKNVPKSKLKTAKECLIEGFRSGVADIKMIRDFEIQSIAIDCFNLSFRQLIRHTSFYKWLMLQNMNPEILPDFHLESRTKFFRKKLKSVSGRKDFVEYEILCLLRGDVPIFYQCPLETHLYDGDGGVYKNFFLKTASLLFEEKKQILDQKSYLKKNIDLLQRIKI